MIVPYYDNTMDLKEFVQKIGLLDIYIKYRHYCYFIDMERKQDLLGDSAEKVFKRKFELPLDYTPYESFEYFAIAYAELWHICEKIYNARRAKVARIRKRLYLMFKYCNCKNFLFLTLTFRDDVIDNTSAKTRRVYARRYLTSLNCSYVGNKDFGGRFGREHYHCIVAREKVDYNDWFKYGAINFKKIRDFEKDITKLAPYIDKLANHSTKVQSGSILYSRDMKHFKELESSLLDDDVDFPF